MQPQEATSQASGAELRGASQVPLAECKLHERRSTPTGVSARVP